MKILQLDRIASPIGELVLVVDGVELVALDYAEYEQRMLRLLGRRYGEFALEPEADPHGYSRRVQAYLAGDMAALNVIPVSTGGTPFQRQVWSALREIPAGSVISYGQLAAKLGRPNAARAVGMSNSLNPIAIVLPCHRVVGANNSLTGYAGGLERKAWLLEHERGS